MRAAQPGLFNSGLVNSSQVADSLSEKRMKTMKFLSPVLLLSVTAPVIPQAQRDPCKGDTTYEMKQCSGTKYKQADAELNKVYQQLLSKLDDEGHKASLKAAQLAWLKYRDTNCDFEGIQTDLPKPSVDTGA